MKWLHISRFLRPLTWWCVGFISAFGLLFLLSLWMAGSVYSELPSSAKLDASSESNIDGIKYDVIVCLTGGRGRIKKALELYEKGFGRILYISGADPQTHIRRILKDQQWTRPIDDSNIILEQISTNTIQNALQVKMFLEGKGYRKILLVTSIYHVRRAHYIFQNILPHIRLEVSWYEQEPFESSVWWKSWNGIWVTLSEFFKFFYAYLWLKI